MPASFSHSHGRRQPRSMFSMQSHVLVMLLLSMSLFCRAMSIDTRRSTGDFLPQSIVVDQSPAPTVTNAPLRRRDTASDSSSSTADASESVTSSVTTSDDGNSTTSTSSSGTSRQTGTSTRTSVIASYTSTSLPQPFDTSLGSNFTSSSCPSYFATFLSNSTFKACMPVSLLLQNSLSFFQALRDPPVLATTLDASCNASLAICSPLMSSIATTLVRDENCGSDFKRQNPLVTQAYAGLLAYEPLYSATCLRDNSTDGYCFVEAMTNSNGTSDSYPYYTAVGIALPAAARPSCTPCLRETMGIFAEYAQQSNQPLTTTYLQCASQIDASCGADFANTQITVASPSPTNDAMSTGRPTFIMGIVWLAMVWAALI